MSANDLDNFVTAVAAGRLIPDPGTMFNPWGDHDLVHDQSPDAPQIRADHLFRYLAARLGRARVLLIAEAPSYSGAKFSGMAMTSERDVLARCAGGHGNEYFDGGFRRTSRELPQLKNRDGMLERTASIVWGAMRDQNWQARDFVLWNAVAYHPHLPGQPLTNRAPSVTERRALRPLLEQFLALFPGVPRMAIGRICQASLADMGIEALPARHPSYGGAPEFRAAVSALRDRLTDGQV
ncbi:uracil-DNA glycosylase [Methyloversatilis sp.]|uniref:uracil-DNA glycosylase n=1 Tax=Methyloversatilis sp. TaxID=2569862 RepID=UPI002737705D|nr:uracil-DNA glycosylase [Methyloversatilis sp.]MDP2868466.1 uracil-DNA glycosylase [Methyloversatilis sp.]MDP3287254.1 uracil-DNA glycosylase [Methyloversatilis sp.]MDP3456578.1 uracil-DNA glycosylase [Methyloversatilis sp.]MDP3579269.1 uracil-DNA glycosylase [Methyloversatilis sp.]